MILMLVLMGSVSAVAQGLKIKRFSYAKSGETLKGEKLYARTQDGRSWESDNGYANYPWIVYLENGGHVQFELPDGQKHQVESGQYSFSYYNNGEKMFIHVRVVPYAVPYLGQLRLQGAVSHANVRLEKTVSEEDFFTYTINSDLDLKTIKIQSGGGREINGNKGIYATIIKEFPQGNYRYASELPHQELFAQGVSVQYLKEQAHNRGLDPNDFVLQIALDSYGGGSIFSEVYKDQAREELKTTFLRILDNRPQIKKVMLTTQVSPAGAGSVLINESSQPSIQVDQGTQVHLEARVARQEYEFDHWEDAPDHTLGNAAEFNHVVSKDQTITAVFKKKAEEKCTLTVKVEPEHVGKVLLDGKDQSSVTVKKGTHVRLKAEVVDQNYEFRGWKTARQVSLGNQISFDYPVDETETVIAVFETKPEEKRTLTVKVSPEQVGKVLLDGENQSSITVKRRTSVRLKVEVVDQNYEFRRWETAGGVSLGKLNPFDYLVEETETVIAVFEKKASAPQVGPVEINFGQREAILTWAAGSATSWKVKVYQGEQVVFDQEIQTPQLVLVGLKPGENYRYEIVAKMSGKLPSQAVQGSFRTDQFDVNDSLTPYLKNFSKLERNKSFPIIFLDVDPRDFPQGMSVEAYSENAQEVRTSLALRNDGNIQWLTLPEGNAKTLRLVLKSGLTTVYILRYRLD